MIDYRRVKLYHFPYNRLPSAQSRYHLNTILQRPECKLILEKLRNELPDYLLYHNLNHTLDVCQRAEQLALEEGISEEETRLLLVAAAYHDCGYLQQIEDHEEVSAAIAVEELPAFGYSTDEIAVISSLILATKLPQTAKNLLQQIICDADLDYLGRDDFFTLGQGLFFEMRHKGVVQDEEEWDKMQIHFLENHHYFTASAIKERQDKQNLHLSALKQKRPTPVTAKNPTKIRIIDVTYALAGILFCAFALKGFLIPNQFFDGGVTGLSLLLHELYHWNIAYVIIAANIPLIILGGFIVGKGFALRTFLAIAGLAICILFIPYPQITSDKLLVSIFGGVFMGIGIGLAMRGGYALDGVEVLAMYTGKWVSFTISEIILGINIIIFLIAALELGLPTALYSILTYYTASRTINFVVEGLEEYTGVTIISGESEKIKEALVMKLGRGITVYKGERGFLKESYNVSYPCDIVFTVVTRMELRRLKNIVNQTDPKAFVFTNIIKEAAGGVLRRRARH
jgi:uncharacterized membrane-anchored protein YitT (DUF2179 family)